jgi:hypothetical protein
VSSRIKTIVLTFAAFWPILAALTLMSLQPEPRHWFTAVNALSIVITAALIWIHRGLRGRRWPVLLLLVPIWAFQVLFLVLYWLFSPFEKGL